jgi:hypothetical protein
MFKGLKFWKERKREKDIEREREREREYLHAIEKEKFSRDRMK